MVVVLNVIAAGAAALTEVKGATFKFGGAVFHVQKAKLLSLSPAHLEQRWFLQRSHDLKSFLQLMHGLVTKGFAMGLPFER